MKGVAEEFVIEISDRAPKAIFVKATFRQKTMDMGVPFEIAPECMENTDKAWNEVALVIQIVEEAGDYLIHGLKEQIQQ